MLSLNGLAGINALEEPQHPRKDHNLTMSIFTVQSPSGRSFDVDATSQEHAVDYITRRFSSGFETSGNSVAEPDARLVGPFGPPPKKQEDAASFQDYLVSLEPPARPPIEEPPQPLSIGQPFGPPTFRASPQQLPPQPPASHGSMTNRLAQAAAIRLARLRAGNRSTVPPDFLMKLRGYR